MSVQAVKDVLDYAPEDLTPSELLVLLCIAEDVRKDGLTREWGGRDALALRTRLSEKTVRNVTSQLVKRGLIVGQHKARLGVVQNWRLATLGPATRRAVFDPRRRPTDDQQPSPRQATITPITTTRKRKR